nr:12348_t:CDS:1 [Entrophospora candida]
MEKIEIPEQWRNQYKILYQALANFSTALFSEEFIMEAVNCEKLKIPLNQRINRLLPLITKQMRIMAARKPASTNVDYKTERSFNKKYDELEVIFLSLFHISDEQQKITKVQKILSLIKSLTPGEIKVLKGKGKDILWYFLNKYAKREFYLCPPLKDFTEAMVDLVDAILDENLMSEGWKITIEVLEAFIEQINLNSIRNPFENYEQVFEKFSENEFQKSFVQKLKKLGLENRLLKQLQDCTQHLNLLAGAETDFQISDADEQEINRKLQGAKSESENNNSQEQRSLSFISPIETFSNFENQGPGNLPRDNQQFDS